MSTPISTILLLLLALLLPPPSTSLSCFCGASPCETPSCCASGTLTRDACGCCPACAKALGEACGGPFRTSGQCGIGLSCLRQCECKSKQEDSRDCVFPFRFRGVEYRECVREDAKSEDAWCATKVDSEGNMLEGSRAECREGCPGTRFTCDAAELFNHDGRCVAEAERMKIEADHKGRAPTLIYTFDDGVASNVSSNSSSSSSLAPACQNPQEQQQQGGGSVNKRCFCTRQISLGEEGHCSRRPNSTAAGRSPSLSGPSPSWCFLEQVADPADAARDCFADATWSPAWGRFWSTEACAAAKY